LQLEQLAVDGVAGVKNFSGHGLGVHAVADARYGTGVEQADVFGVQVFGEEEFIDQAVEEALVFRGLNSGIQNITNR